MAKKAIKKDSPVVWTHREFPLHSDGTTAGDRGGWVVRYIAKVLKRDKKICRVVVLKQESTGIERGFECDVHEHATAFLNDLELIE